jgi:hypothetical protein
LKTPRAPAARSASLYAEYEVAAGARENGRGRLRTQSAKAAECRTPCGR